MKRISKGSAWLLAGIIGWMGLVAWNNAATRPALPTPREIAITLDDTLRTPNAIEAKEGERVEFVVHNSGTQPHEFVIGDTRAVSDYTAKMRGVARGIAGAGGVEIVSVRIRGESDSEVASVNVKPGQTSRLAYRFKAGKPAYACL